MKKTLAALLLIVGFAFGIAQNAQAESKDKAITISGKGCCAKCCLKETDACQNAVTVEKDGKKTVYYLVQNDVSNAGVTWSASGSGCSGPACGSFTSVTTSSATSRKARRCSKYALPPRIDQVLRGR